jgi:hypothetical protein
MALSPGLANGSLRWRKRFSCDSLDNATARVVVAILRPHGIVFDGDQTVEEIPGAGEAIDFGHVAVGVVRKVSGFEFRVSS